MADILLSCELMQRILASSGGESKKESGSSGETGDKGSCRGESEILGEDTSASSVIFMGWSRGDSAGCSTSGDWGGGEASMAAEVQSSVNSFVLPVRVLQKNESEASCTAHPKKIGLKKLFMSITSQELQATFFYIYLQHNNICTTLYCFRRLCRDVLQTADALQ